MKKSLVGGLIAIALAPTAFGQGHVIVSNYLFPPYAQVYWHESTPSVGGQAVRSGAVQLSLWYGLGNIADENALTLGQSFTVDLTGDSAAYDPVAGHGAGGFYNIIGLVPGWSSGPVTFQIRASGDTPFGQINSAASRSALWTEAGVGGQASPAPNGTFGAGLAVVVPEPTTFALLGVGAAALALVRRRG